MKAQRIYVDTSVIGGCHDEEFEPWSRGLMDDFRDGVFRPVVSKIVTLEIEEAPAPVQQNYAELLRLSPDVLEVSGRGSNACRQGYKSIDIRSPREITHHGKPDGERGQRS
jgi:hypothetical protein